MPEGFSFTFKNRGIPMPYEPLGVWLIDQWRQIGLNVKQEVIEAAAYYGAMRKRATSRCAMDFQCGYIVEPDLDLYKFLSTDRNPRTTAATRTRCSTSSTTSRAARPTPRSASSSCAQFEKRLLDEEAHYLMTLQWHRIIPHSRQGEGLDDHAEPLPEQHARHGLADAVEAA